MTSREAIRRRRLQALADELKRTDPELLRSKASTAAAATGRRLLIPLFNTIVRRPK